MPKVARQKTAVLATSPPSSHLSASVPDQQSAALTPLLSPLTLVENARDRGRKRNLGTDHLAGWQPMLTAEQPEDSDCDAPLDTEEEPSGNKRKEPARDVHPNIQWREFKSLFLDEILRHEGLADFYDDPTCVSCHARLDPSTPDSVRLFRCDDCGNFPRCRTCMIRAHQLTPLHFIEEWNGSFWTDASLADIGLVYQLGHGGMDCTFPDMTTHSMTVVDAPFIHRVRFQYCACPKSRDTRDIQQLLRHGWYPATVKSPRTCATFRTLRSFRLYNVVGNLNMTDFVSSLQRMTKASATGGLGSVSDCTKQMHRMERQWSFLSRLKRSGRGHEPTPLDELPLGACAVQCWACPHDGRNLPANWRDVSAEYRIAFAPEKRLIPPLGRSLAYWVDHGQYQAHIQKYVTEADISSCVSFAALAQKDTRGTTGLRVSGVGGCICARHECMRPNGLGDLQKGECYCNMDFIFFSAIMSLVMLWLTISYDVACQWKLHLRNRMERLPPPMHKNLQETTVQFGLPVWHSPAHKTDCQNENDLALKRGVGKTDGEGIERFWSRMNAAAYSSKEMSFGHRADFLDDRIDNNNYTRNMTLRSTLQRRLVVARAECRRQTDAFDAVNEGIDPELQREWAAEVLAYEADNTKPNPYVLRVPDCQSEAQIRLQLQQQEKAQDAQGYAAVAGSSATSFIAAGIEIEDAQRRLHRHIKTPSLVTANHELRTEERRTALLKKIGRFRQLQPIFMPGASPLLDAEEEARESHVPSPPPESIELLMPSQMPLAADGSGPAGCLRGVATFEECQRVAQCENSLSELRCTLHAKRWLIGHRNANLTGQRATTKAAKLFSTMTGETNLIVARYRCGYRALKKLGALERHPHLRVLHDSDVTINADNAYEDIDARQKLARIGSRASRPSRNMPSRSRRIMSWIWTAPGAFCDEEQHLHDSMRVEWARALARKDRWTEEVALLEEEMRRTLRYLDWQEEWWRNRVSARDRLEPGTAAGLPLCLYTLGVVQRVTLGTTGKVVNTPIGLASGDGQNETPDLKWSYVARFVSISLCLDERG
ncbi:CxC2 domain-containing protein [Mycena kentingensis (nom. inval.)]|nr:CxC2 domain-containing protein [Mycena kentingensis (nom. inval.)]